MDVNPYKSPKLHANAKDESYHQPAEAPFVLFFRLSGCGVLGAVVGAVVGLVGAFLVWNFTYGIGSRVITDAMYEQYHGTVCLLGCMFGASSWVVSGIVLSLAGNRAIVWLVLSQVPAGLVCGAVGATRGWCQGLIGYFGSQTVVLLLAIALAICDNNKARHSKEPAQGIVPPRNADGVD